jgi:hypothetical protein
VKSALTIVKTALMKNGYDARDIVAAEYLGARNHHGVYIVTFPDPDGGFTKGKVYVNYDGKGEF